MDFRRHIQRTSKCELKTTSIKKAGEAKVGDLDGQIVDVLGLEQDVFRLQVTVGNVLLMHIVDGQQHLRNDMRGLLLREGLLLNEAVK